MYRQALDAPLEETEHESAIRSIWKLYADKDQKDNGIAALEALKPKIEASPTLLELLADAYKETDDTEKADTLYAEWLAIREKEANRRQSPAGYLTLARVDSRQRNLAGQRVRIRHTRIEDELRIEFTRQH